MELINVLMHEISQPVGDQFTLIFSLTTKCKRKQIWRQCLLYCMCVQYKVIRHNIMISRTSGHLTFWISLSLCPKFGLRPKISQKVKSFSFGLSDFTHQNC